MKKFSKRSIPLLAVPAVALLTAPLLLAQSTQPAPVRGGSVVVAMNVEPGYLDPTAGAGAEIVRMMHQNVLEGLMGFAENGRVVPQLAAGSPTISRDRLTYTFKLRRGVKFHDGSDFTSSDVKIKFDYARDPKTTHTSPTYYANIESVTTPDALTVVFKLKTPNNDFLYNLARAESIIEPGEQFGTAAGREVLKNKPVGTGPFKLEAWNRGVSVRLSRNDSYYVSGLPYLDAATFRFLGDDQNAKVAGMRSGDIDIIAYNVPAEQVASLRNDFNVIVGNSSGEITVSMNNQRKPFDDVRVRRAFTQAMDKASIIKGGFFGFGTVIGSFNSPGQPYFVDLSKRNPYNPEAARTLLRNAGYNAGTPIKFTVANEFPIERRTAEIYAQQLSRIGVNVQIELVPFNTWIDKVFSKKDYDMTIIGHAESYDLDRYARDGYYFNWNNAPYKALYEKALVASTTEERNRLFIQMQYMLADQVPGIWVMTAPYIAASRKNVYGWWNNQAVLNANLVRVFKTR
jgi:peptide/nickel transport system substrate-binding protein